MARLTKEQYIQKMKNYADVETQRIMSDNHVFTKYITDILYANYCAMYEFIKRLAEKKWPK